ncbi:MAG: hypothetical protein ACFFAS_20065 [Promethearchaeota archaeon]
MRLDINCVPISKITEILNSLVSFKGKYDKKFNFTLLARHFKLNNQEAHALVDLILAMQDILRTTFQDYRLKKKNEKGVIYLITEKLMKNIPSKINIQKKHIEMMGDLIYSFLEIRRGKGFDIEDHNCTLARMVKAVREQHPYFFYKNGSELVYPSKLGLELGRSILSLKKLNKTLSILKIGRHEIEVDGNE